MVGVVLFMFLHCVGERLHYLISSSHSTHFFWLYFTLGIPKTSSMFQAKDIHFIYYSAELWLVLVVAAPVLVEWKFKLDSSRALEAVHFFKVIVV